jgi:hypothetical protein
MSSFLCPIESFHDGTRCICIDKSKFPFKDACRTLEEIVGKCSIGEFEGENGCESCTAQILNGE